MKQYKFVVVNREAITTYSGRTKMVDRLVFGKSVFKSAEECVRANIAWMSAHPMKKFMIWEEEEQTDVPKQHVFCFSGRVDSCIAEKAIVCLGVLTTTNRCRFY